MSSKIKMAEKTYYKMRMEPIETGLSVITQEWVAIHETPLMHFCINKYDVKRMKWMYGSEDLPPLQAAKANSVKVKRIYKSGSRFAFDTKEKAFEHLQFLKRKQIGHLKRDIELITEFLAGTENKTFDDLAVNGLYHMVPNTDELVQRFYAFD